MSDFADLRAGNSSLELGTALSTVSSGTASVDIGGTTFTCKAVRGLTLASGDPVIVGRVGSARYVIARTETGTAATPENDTPPPPKPAVVTGKLVVAPVETRSYRDSKWRTDSDDVIQGVVGGYGNSTGCAFYGRGPRSLAGATVTDCKLRVRRERGGVFAAQTSTLRLVTQSTRPAGAPTLTSSTTGPALAVDRETSTFDVPTAWAQAMVDGTSGGLAVYDAGGTPYIRFAGRGSWGPAWTLTIYWRR